MERRELLKMIALATGAAVVGGDLFLTGCKSADGKFIQFSAEQLKFLDEVAETILPRTASPGAKDAKVAAFMEVMVRDCYTKEDQNVFIKGIDQLDEYCKKHNGKGFMECSAEERKSCLIDLDKEAKAYNKQKQESKEKKPNHYFSMMKQLTLLGFFTSEPGATQALRHVAVPGRYDGCIPYKKGDKAWA